MGYAFSSGTELLDLTDKHGTAISDITINYSAEQQNLAGLDILGEMQRRLQVIREAIDLGMQHAERSASGLSGGDAQRLTAYAPDVPLLGQPVKQAITYSFAIMEHNARFGRIVAFPTAGSAGTVPGCLLAAAEALGKDDAALVRAMFTSAGIGMIIGNNAMLAGATGGCQAEVGSASAMAAAALTELRGGSPDQCFQAAAIALKGLLGLVCDPIGGLVEAPCVKRNATAIANAFMASDLALAGIVSNVPFDEVVEAMRNIGRSMPASLRETAKGGLAATETGKRVWCAVMGDES